MPDSETPSTNAAVTAADALKYAAALARYTSEFPVDSISGSCCDGDHDAELDAVHAMVDEIEALAGRFGHPNLYTDGRRVRTSAWILDNELRTTHVWHPDPSAEEPRSWRGHLSSGGPGLPSPGVYEVTTDPVTQQIHSRVVRVSS